MWSVPEQEAAERLGSRLRELRAHMRSRSQKAPELLRREHRGQFAFLGDLVTWVGVLRRLQTVIEQANLKYRAADVFGLSVALAVCCFLLTTLFGMMFFLRILFAVLAGLRAGGLHPAGAVAADEEVRRACCPTRSTCSPAPCAPATTSTAVWRPSPRRPAIR